MPNPIDWFRILLGSKGDQGATDKVTPERPFAYTSEVTPNILKEAGFVKETAEERARRLAKEQPQWANLIPPLPSTGKEIPKAPQIEQTPWWAPMAPAIEQVAGLAAGIGAVDTLRGAALTAPFRGKTSPFQRGLFPAPLPPENERLIQYPVETALKEYQEIPWLGRLATEILTDPLTYIIGAGVATKGTKDAGVRLLDKAFDLSKLPKGALKGANRKIWQTAEDLMTQTGKPLSEITPEEMLKGFFGTIRKSIGMAPAEAAQVGAKEAIVPAAKGAVKVAEEAAQEATLKAARERTPAQEFLQMGKEAFDVAAQKGKIAPFVKADETRPAIQSAQELKAVAGGTKPVAWIDGGALPDAKKLGLVTKRIPAFKGDPAGINVWAAYKPGTAGREAFAKLADVFEQRGAGTLDKASYHVELGRALGYSENDIAKFLKETYGNFERITEVARPAVEPLAQVRQVAQTETEEQVLARISQRLAEWRPLREEVEPIQKAFTAKQAIVYDEAKTWAKSAGMTETEQHVHAMQALTSLGERPTPFKFANEIITTEEKNLLYKIIDRELPKRPFDQIHAKEGLEKLLSPDKLPEPAQAALLERIFGFKFMEDALKRRQSLGFKVLENVYTILNVPRSIKASWDLSAPLRQGQILIPGHPKESASAFKWMLKALGSKKDTLFMDDLLHGRVGKLMEAGFKEEEAIAANVKATRALDHHLFLHDLRYGGKISEREEMFISRFGSKYGQMAKKWTGIEFSERTYATFLNKQRSDVFNKIVDGWEASGKYVKADGSFNKELWDEDLVELARFINRATGRGELWKGEYQMTAKPFNSGSPAAFLNIGFFAPRLTTSRPLLIGSLFSQSPAVRKQAAMDLSKFWAAQATVMGLVALSSDDVSLELDPRSAQAWKLRYKDTFYDISAGFQPLIRYAAQFFLGRKSQSGWISPRDPWQTALRLGESKTTPIVSSIMADLSGVTFTGQEVPEGWKGAAMLMDETLTPLAISALIEAGTYYGNIPSSILASPEIIGGGVSTYQTAGAVTMDYWSMRSQLEDLVKQWKDARLARDPDKLYKLEQDHPELNMQFDPSLGDYFSDTLRTLRSYDARKGGIAELSKKENEVQLNPDLSNAEKRRMIDELERHKDLLATQAILEVEGLYDTKWNLMDLPDLVGDGQPNQTQPTQPTESRPGLAPGLENFRD